MGLLRHLPFVFYYLSQTQCDQLTAIITIPVGCAFVDRVRRMATRGVIIYTIIRKGEPLDVGV